MAKVAIIYGSSTGNTRDASHKLQQIFGTDTADIIDVTEAGPETFNQYKAFVFAVSTWGSGTLQDDWEEFLPYLDEMDLTGVKVAVMGLGDQRNYPDTFGDAAAILADRVSDRGATLVGHTVPEDYEYTASRSERENKLVGLLIDEDSQSHLTDVRLKNWVNMLRRQFDV